MDRVNMKTELGTKWFTFFTKVRPWLSILVACAAFSEFIKNIETYQQYWWQWFYLLLSVATVVLQVLVFAKSRGNYIKFVRFVEIEMIFEGVSMCCQWIVELYTTHMDAKEALADVEMGRNMIEQQLAQDIALGIFRVVLFSVLYYFLWYRLNRKYFRKRLRSAALENTPFVSEENSVTQINVVLDNVGEEAHKLVYRVQPMQLSADFVDNYGWRAELATLKSDEVYRRYCDAEEWSEDYRALCYQELVKRQETTSQS